MSRVIYSLYIDIPKQDLDYQAPYAGDDIPKTERTKLQFIKHYDKLLQCKQTYAKDCNVDFIMYEYDDQFKQYKKWWNNNYPQITEYNIVNFYKLYLLDKLADQYDEILYLDFDVIPVKSINFFEEWDLSKGIAIYSNNGQAKRELRHISKGPIESVRSPTAKYWNCFALLTEEGLDANNDVFNTGIIGASAYHIKQLNYFEDIDSIIQQMDELTQDEMYPEYMRDMFGYDNETIWSFLIQKKQIPIQWLTWHWHLFYNYHSIVPKAANFVHVINKRFEEVIDFYEKNYL
jgi:hypothetical protein